MNSRWLVLLAVGALSVPAAAQTVRYEGGVSLASGDYIFTERTTSWTVSNGFALGRGPLTLRATVPVYVQNTTLIAGTMGGVLPTGGGGEATRAVRDSSMARKGRGRSMAMIAFSTMATGEQPVQVPTSALTGYQTRIGDPTVGVALLPRLPGGTAIGLNATVKLPLTDTTDFGTGQWDAGAGVSLSHPIGRSALAGIDVGYWVLGDLPDLDLRNPWLAGVSITVMRPGGWAMSLTGSGARSVIDGFPDAYSVRGTIGHVTSGTVIGISAAVGLTDTAPDLTVGLHWGLTLLRR